VAVEGDLHEQELQNLETIFQKKANIFRHFLKGQDDVSLGKIANLADRFSGLSSLSSLDLSLDLERSVTQVAAQIASEFVGQGGAGNLDLSSQNREAVSTASSSPFADSDSDQGGKFGLGALNFSGVASVVQQILDALNTSHLEPRKVHEHLPSLLARLRDEVGKELRDERTHKDTQPKDPVSETTVPLSVNAAVALADESVRESSASLSLHG